MLAAAAESRGCAGRSLKYFAIGLRKVSVCVGFEERGRGWGWCRTGRSREDAVDEFLGELLGAFGEGAGKEDDGVDAGHFEVDGFAGVFGGGFEGEAGVAAAGEGDGADAGIADELEAVFVADVVDQLNGGGGRPACWRASRASSARRRVVSGWRVGFGDDGVAGGDGGGEISAADAVEGEGKVVGAEDDDGADRGEAGADVFFEVDGGVAPGLFATAAAAWRSWLVVRGSSTSLRRGADGKGGLFGCGGDDAVGGGFDVRRRLRGRRRSSLADGAEFGGGFGCGGEGGVTVGPAADGECKGEGFALGGIFRVEGSLGGGCAPFAVDQYMSYIHWCFLLTSGYGVGWMDS